MNITCGLFYSHGVSGRSNKQRCASVIGGKTMWSEICIIDYDQAVRSTAWYGIVSQRRDQDLEYQLCQAASRRPWLRPASWLTRWLAGVRVARQGRLARREELKWAHKSMVL
jgi:hypothetical protein